MTESLFSGLFGDTPSLSSQEAGELTIAKAIELRSEYIIGVDIKESDLPYYVKMAGNKLNSIIGNRAFSADQLTELKALMICDIVKNKPGKGTIIQESVTDSSWKSNVKTSSYFMDEILTIVTDFDNDISEVAINIDPVRRSDSHISGVVDGYPYRGETIDHHHIRLG